MPNRGHADPIIPHNINQIRRMLYRSGRILGDVNAINRALAGDPTAISKRILRRVVGRGMARVLWGKLLR